MFAVGDETCKQPLCPSEAASAFPLDQDVQIRLTPDDALVLFEFLQRFDSFDLLSIEDQSEQRALWNLSCLLEKQLAAPFQTTYADLFESA